VLNAYLAAMDGKCKPRTFKLRLDACKLFGERYGQYRCSDIKPLHVHEIIAERRQGRVVKGQFHKWGDGQAGVFILSLKAGFNWAVKQQMIDRNPLATVSVPKSVTKSRERVLTPAEHATVLAALTGPRTACLRRLVVALENTGARPGELTNAKVGDWRPDIGALFYHRDTARREGEFSHKSSRKKDRVIYFTGEALEMVRELVRDKPADALIFPTRTGRNYTDRGLNSCFKGIRERTGIGHLVPYVYRHTFATRWLKAGESIEILATALGNTPAVIMHHYSHLLHEFDAVRDHIERVRGK
jgi:integrase